MNVKQREELVREWLDAAPDEASLDDLRTSAVAVVCTSLLARAKHAADPRREALDLLGNAVTTITAMIDLSYPAAPGDTVRRDLN